MNLETGAAGHPTITINLTAEGANSWASAAAVLTPDTPTASIYPHGFEAIGPTESNGVQDAGFFTATPLPAALPLFATGLGGLGLLGWRRKGKAQAD